MIELQALIDNHFEGRKKEEEELLALKERIVSLNNVISTTVSSPEGYGVISELNLHAFPLPFDKKG